MRCCRLDNLRKIVPHSERANTAAFLEEVYNYVEAMQKRVLDLEQAQKTKLVQVAPPLMLLIGQPVMLHLVKTQLQDTWSVPGCNRVAALHCNKSSYIFQASNSTDRVLFLQQAIAKPPTAKPDSLTELTTIPEGIGEGSRPKSVTPPPPASNGGVVTPHGASSEESGQPCKRRRA